MKRENNNHFTPRHPERVRHSEQSEESPAKTRRFFALLRMTVLISSSAYAASTKMSDTDEMHAAPTPLRSLQSSVRVNNRLFLFNSNISEFVSMPFDLNTKTRSTRFGSYTDVVRIKAPTTRIPGEWRGVIASTNTPSLKTITLWDAAMLQLVQINEKDGSIIQETAAPNDSIKPPRDRSGEPTVAEVKKSRLAFKANFKKVFGPRYSGMTAMPADWDSDASRKKYFVATKIKDFPLTILSCDKNDSVACHLDRFCFLEGGPTIEPKAISGTAVYSENKKKIVMIGDSSKNQIHVYNFNSCFDLRFIKTLDLPNLHGTLTSISSDEDSNLWVTTHQWDNRFDSNLFFWELKSLGF